MKEQPKGELTIRVLAMPADTNPSGDVFGGWIMSQMDIAGGQFCRSYVKDRIVTVAVNSIIFKSPVFVGDALCCYVDLVRIGNSSITVHVEAWASRGLKEHTLIKVTEGDYVYVRVGKNGKSLKINHK